MLSSNRISERCDGVKITREHLIQIAPLLTYKTRGSEKNMMTPRR